MADQQADLDWTDAGIPVSRRFGDTYFSIQGGLEETRHVFLAGNDLPARFRDGFQIAELGFGSGLNLLTTAAAWRDAGLAGTLHFTSFEAHAMAAGDMARALAPFPQIASGLPALMAALAAGPGPHDLPGGIRLTVIPGDARQTLPAWQGRADAWYLDGFAPARNPEMWSSDLMAEVARHLAPGGSLATYTAAGHVRRALAAAGLIVERAAGFGPKRHMTRGRRP